MRATGRAVPIAAAKGGVFAARMAVALVAALLVLALSALPGHTASALRVLTGRVVDNAGLLDAATEAEITKKLADFEAKSSDQVVVATIDSLNGEAIEPYANRLFRVWGLGQKQENNGILLLVAKNDRKVRIEVGYGLEGTMTDLASKLIIENTIIPAFRQGDFAGGISNGVDDILSVLSGDTAELEARAARNRTSTSNGPNWPAYIFLIIWFGIFFSGFGLAVLPRLFGRKIGPNRYRWLGHDFVVTSGRGGGWSGGGGGWSSGGGGFSGGGGSSGGGGASGGW